MSDTNEYECPVCEEWVAIPLPLAAWAVCPGCRRRLNINVDAEFDRGMWHDRTTLSEAKGQP